MKSPSGPTEILIFKMYISSFAIWVIPYTFYGKSEVGQLSHTTLKRTSLFQDKQGRMALNKNAILNIFFESQLQCLEQTSIKHAQKRPPSQIRKHKAKVKISGKISQSSKVKQFGKRRLWKSKIVNYHTFKCVNETCNPPPIPFAPFSLPSSILS